MEGSANDVTLIRGGQVEWHINDLSLRMDAPEALSLAQRALLRLGWSTVNQLGLRVAETVTVMPDERRLRDEQERLRANGKAAASEVVERPLLVGTWQPQGEGPIVGAGAVRAKERRFSKEPATGPSAKHAPPRRPPTRTIERPLTNPSIEQQLFEDPVEQLRYEVRHAYLMTVPISQRSQWPLQEYVLLPSFIPDLDRHDGALSRWQIVSALVDVVSSRMNDVNSRRPRQLREGGGDDGRAVIVRADGATAWRANVNSGTPAARRIMWWRAPSGVLELARLATHDDFEMPER